MDFTEKTLSTKQIYDGKILGLRVDTVELPGGNTATREVVEHSGGVCVAALDEKDRLLFVRQFRYPHGRVLLELPAGKINKGEDPAACGFRELIEETGYRAGTYFSLGEFIPSSAYLEEVIYLYFASDLTLVGQNLDEDEFLSVERIPLDKAEEMVLSGEIRDGKTIALVLKVAALKARSALKPQK